MDVQSANFPVCKSSTEELQNGLDMISQRPKMSHFASAPSLHSFPFHSQQQHYQQKVSSDNNNTGPQPQALDSHHANTNAVLSRPFLQDVANTHQQPQQQQRTRHESNNTAEYLASMGEVSLENPFNHNNLNNYQQQQQDSLAVYRNEGLLPPFKTPKGSKHQPFYPLDSTIKTKAQLQGGGSSSMRKLHSTGQLLSKMHPSSR